MSYPDADTMPRFHTAVCDLLGIAVPVAQAPIGPLATPELAAAVSNTGGLGVVAAIFQSATELGRTLAQVRDRTDRPFAVNFVLNNLDEAAFAAALAAKPRAVSLALGDPGDHVIRAQDAGCLVIQQVHTVRGAIRAAELGVDVIVAQGGEAGGNSGSVAALPLVPQVVDAVRPVPVLAAGGIADGRGLAAALVLGAQGVWLGTRFLAAAEAPSSEGWKRAIIHATSEDAIKFDPWNAAFPPLGGDYMTSPRAIRTPFIDEWTVGRDLPAEDAARLHDLLVSAGREGRLEDLVPLTGQAAGLIDEVLPTADIVRRLIIDAKDALSRASQFAWTGELTMA